MKKHSILFGLSLASIILAGCGGTPAQQSASQPGGGSNDPGTTNVSDSEPESEYGFNVLTDFSEPVSIHTDAQAEYLAYDGDYATMPENMYPDGKSHQSDSKPVEVEWEYGEPDDASLDYFSVIYGQKADLSDGYEIEVGTKTKAKLYNPYLGVNYYQLIAHLDNEETEESDIMSFEVEGTYPRNLTIGGMTNCRDMGGRVTADGGKIKQGLVYRTSGFKYDYSTQITEDGKKEMLEHLGVKTEVNVADGQNYNLKLPGTTVKNFFMDYSGGSHHFSRNAESVKHFFRLLADESNYPVYFHCRIGTDRTGLCAILLSGLLGVSINEIYQDYLFSNFGHIQEKRYIGPKAGADNIQNYVNAIMNVAGETFANKVYNTLLAVGLTKAELNAVINNLTEGTGVQGNDAGQIVALGADLTGNGVSASSNNGPTDRNNPDKYFVLDSASKSVSYNFNVSAAGEGQIVAYLGNTDHSTSKKISDAISVTIDDAPVAVTNMTYADAGMGQCGSRMNYFPVILGTSNLTAGAHTIKIIGSSNKMNVANVCIFGAAGGGQGGGGQGGGETHTTHNYQPETPQTNIAGKQVTTYLCECGAKYIAINFNDYSSMPQAGTSADPSKGKLGKGAIYKWDIPAKAGNVTLQFCVAATDNYHITSGDGKFVKEQWVFKVNGSAIANSLVDQQTYQDAGITTSGQYFNFASFSIENDMNVELEFDHNITDYRLAFSGEVRLVYEA